MAATGQRVAVIGGGWAGLAAAVEAVRLGHEVTLYEMAPQLGGRARQVDADGVLLDNGQHILIGAYRETLDLMREVGVPLDEALLRMPLRVTYPDGSGLQLPAGAPVPAFARAMLRYRGWTWGDKLAMLRAASGWALRRFRCPEGWAVERLIAALPQRVRDDLLDPLCVAALNTPAGQASASVFLRVLKDALFSGPGSADLLLPRWRLSALWPEPAARWLKAHGAMLQLGHRVGKLGREGMQWRVDDEVADSVVLACSATEAARLVEAHAPPWAAAARAFRYEPIVTVYLHSGGEQLPQPMLALRSNSSDAPAQFVFDLGQLGGPANVWAFVVSGAASWIARGTAAVTAATLSQAVQQLGPERAGKARALQTITEKRATFLCTPGLHRPSAHVAQGLVAAGDYVAGPYPATLESAMRSGRAAALALATGTRSGAPTAP
jgi:squalene-associated FAD-dependent desaturase